MGGGRLFYPMLEVSLAVYVDLWQDASVDPLALIFSYMYNLAQSEPCQGWYPVSSRSVDRDDNF